MFHAMWQFMCKISFLFMQYMYIYIGTSLEWSLGLHWLILIVHDVTITLNDQSDSDSRC